MTPKKSASEKANARASAASTAPKYIGGRAVRTEGQRLLLLAPGSLAVVAKKLGASKATVGDWRTGGKLPSPEFRAEMERSISIPASAWTVDPVGTPQPVAAPVPLAASGPPTTIEDVENLLASVRVQLARDGLLSSECVKLTASMTSLLALKHRLEKDGETREDAIVRNHPLWQRIRTILVDALVPFPEAARAVADKLAEIQQG